jgi:protein-tyrosine kinase
MPRIDEALARARTTTSEDPEPPKPQAPAEAAATFALEAEETPSVAPAVHTVQVSDPPVLTDLPITEPPIADPSLANVDAELKDLPLAEKLMPSSRNQTSVEQYRRLAARLYLAQGEDRIRIVMVTSAMPGEGKTLTAANLALTLSESYRRQVLLVDADLRRPCIHELFQVPNLTGLNDGLKSDVDRKVPIIRITDHLTILTAGRPESDPMSTLASDRMRRVLEEAGSTFDWVIVDTPPVGLLSDARLMASLVDTVLLVVRAGSTPTQAIRSAADAVGRDRILGVVLNRAESNGPGATYAYEYYGKSRAHA